MTKEKLLEWGLTEEQATKVMEGLNGSFVTKARFNEGQHRTDRRQEHHQRA